jgi:hypothetical protein
VELKDCYGIDALLLQLHLAPALRLLRIVRRSWEDLSVDDSFAQPNEPALRSLVSKAPQLQVQLVLPEAQRRAYRIWSARVGESGRNADGKVDAAAAAAANQAPVSLFARRPSQFYRLTELAAIERVAVVDEDADADEEK